MRKLSATFTLLLSIIIHSSGQSSSHRLTPAEQNAMPDYLKHAVSPSLNGITTPPSSTVRASAEWEEIDALVVVWTSYTTIVRQIIEAARTETRVIVVCSDSNVVKNNLILNAVPLSNISYLVTGFNSIWCRDYGPWNVYTQDVDSLFLIDWIYNRPRPKDDTLPASIARAENLPMYQTTVSPYDLIHTGGNFMCDGMGTGFSSNLILNENPTKTAPQIDSIMSSFMGINRYIKMNTLPYDQIHHIDMHMKLLDEETLLIGQYPTGVADGPQIETNLAYIQNNFLDCYGRPYKIIRIPQPDDNGQYPDGSGRYLTYTNAIILNHTVIYPHYQISADAVADSIWHIAMPGYRLWPINCGTGSDNIIVQSGAIHCITHEIGVSDPILISHAHLLDTYNTTTPYNVVARIETRSGVSSAKMFWSIDTTVGYTMVSMTAMSNDSFSANIPAQIAGTKIFYYIEASSNSGRTNRRPMVAPEGVFQFTILGAGAAQNFTAQLPQLFNPYPNPANENTVIGFNLSKEENCVLAIYDLSGKQISLLLNEKMSSGTHQFELSLDGISAGTYMLKLKEGNYSATKKLVVIK